MAAVPAGRTRAACGLAAASASVAAPGAPTPLLGSVSLTILDTSNKWNHAVFVFL